MKNKIISLMLYVFVFSSFLFCEEFKFTVTKSKNWKSIVGTDKVINKGDEYYTKGNNGFGFHYRNDSSLIEIVLYNDQSNDSTFIDVNNLSFNENIKSIPENLKEVFWVPLYYYEQINDNKDRNSILFMNEPFWNNWKNHTESRIYNTWQDDFFLGYYGFNDFYLFARSSQFGMDEAIFLVKTENVSTNQVEYQICKMYTHFIAYNEKTSNPQYKFLPLYQKTTPFKIILIIDGDYMKMYIDEVSEKNLFQTLIRTSPEACNQIENWIKGKSNDLSKVVMPKHGNASVQTEVTKINTTNVTPNKTMSVTENLKLRSAEATTSKVLTVMAAGTKVKILELGHSETIDGITSNWVKVEVQADAKDRDGNPIKAGTVGWCYGGYLKLIEEPKADKPSNKKDEKKRRKNK